MIKYLKNLDPKMVLNRFISFNIRAVIAYHVTLNLLGFTSFKPLIIRGLNEIQEGHIPMPTPELFLICASKEQTVGSIVGSYVDSMLGSGTTASGFTIGQLVVCGITMGTVMFGLGLAQEYVLPPLMRNLGWTSWRTPREIALEQARALENVKDNVDTISDKVNVIETTVTTTNTNVYDLNSKIVQLDHNVANNVLNLKEYLKKRLKFEFDNIIAFQTGLTNQLRGLGVDVSGLKSSFGNLNDLGANLYSNINNLTKETACQIREELTSIFDNLNREHENTRNALQQTLNQLREQAAALDSFDPNDVYQASNRVASAIGLLEAALKQNVEMGTRLQETVQPQLERLAVESQILTTTQEHNYSSVPDSRQINTSEVIDGVDMGRDAFDTVNDSPVTQNMQTVVQDNNLAVLHQEPLAEGINFTIQQKTNELIIRLRLKEGTNLKQLEAITQGPSVIQPNTFSVVPIDVLNPVWNMVKDKVISSTLTLAMGSAGAFVTGGVPGVVTHLTASLLNAPTNYNMQNPNHGAMAVYNQPEATTKRKTTMFEDVVDVLHAVNKLRKER